MRLKSFYLCGALAVAAIPLSAGAQSWPTRNQSAPNAAGIFSVRPNSALPAGFWSHAGYLSERQTGAPPTVRHAASQSTTDAIAGKAGARQRLAIQLVPAAISRRSAEEQASEAQ